MNLGYSKLTIKIYGVFLDPTLFDKVTEGLQLQPDEAESLFEWMLSGDLPSEKISGILCSLKSRGETSVELISGAKVLRHHATKFRKSGLSLELADNCGTGGDQSQSFNISTASAILAASMGIPVAKHGNRSVSSKCGSADLLFEAGFPDTLSPDQAYELLEEKGFTFFFAPNFHPIIKNVMPVRKILGVRTIFNLLGPLANPINPTFQLLGVGNKKHLKPIAESLRLLGISKALVVHSDDGFDELSASDITRGYLVKDQKMQTFELDPKSLTNVFCETRPTGGNSSDNLRILRGILENKADPEDACLRFTVLNAAALAWLVNSSPSIEAGVEAVYHTIHSGKAKAFFYDWLDRAKELGR